MTTLRELTTKLGFEADVSQAEKYKKAVRDVNTSLLLGNVSKFSKGVGVIKKKVAELNLVKVKDFNQKIGSVNKKLSAMHSKVTAVDKKLKKNGLSNRIRGWLAGAGAAMKNGLKGVVTSLGEHIKEIDLKRATIRAIVASIATIGAGIYKAASLEQAEERFASQTKDRKHLENLKSHYKEWIKLSDGMYTETDIAEAALAAVKRFNNPDYLINELMPRAIRVAKAQNVDLQEKLETLIDYPATGSERGQPDLWDEREAEVLSAINQSGMLKKHAYRMENLIRRLDEKIPLMEAASPTTTTMKRIRKVKAFVEQGATDFGESFITDDLNKSLDKLIIDLQDVNTRIKNITESGSIWEKVFSIPDHVREDMKTVKKYIFDLFSSGKPKAYTVNGPIVTTPWKPPPIDANRGNTTSNNNVEVINNIEINAGSQNPVEIGEEVKKQIQGVMNQAYHTNRALNNQVQGRNQ